MFTPDGKPLSSNSTDGAATFGVFLNGKPYVGGIHSGGEVADDDLLLIFNQTEANVVFTLPGPNYGDGWQIGISTADPDADNDRPVHAFGTSIEIRGRSVLVLVGAAS